MDTDMGSTVDMKHKTFKKGNKPGRRNGLFGDNLGFASKDSYRILRNNIGFLFVDCEKTPVIGITSSISGEGKTTSSANLSYSIALGGKKVLLLDCDFRMPAVSSLLSVNYMTGLSEYLANMSPLEEVIQKVEEYENWDVIISGKVPPNPAELLGSKKMKQLLEQLRESYDYIIIDLPPLGIVSDALELSDSLDGIMIVVRENYVKKKDLARTMSLIENMPVKFLGYIMNDTGIKNSRYY